MFTALFTFYTQLCWHALGIHRCMFASNFPVDKLNAPFGDLMETHLKISEAFTQEEKDSYFGGLAKKIYKLQ